MTTEIEPKQSLQKLSLKSVKRALDVFSPAHDDQLAPPDPESKKIRLSHKFQVAFGGVEPVSKQSIRRAEYNNNEQIASSNALALPGPEGAEWHAPWKNYTRGTWGGLDLLHLTQVMNGFALVQLIVPLRYGM